jgi:replication initiation and membrane attachment protein DnaB
MKQGFNQQHFSQQQQSANMNPGRSQMFHQGSQQQQQQQQQKLMLIRCHHVYTLEWRHI